MRKVVLGLGISLDGYIARKNGAVDWLSMDWDYDWTTAEFLALGGERSSFAERKYS